MTSKRSYLLVCLAVFAIALGMRTITLYWSPLPATLDGFEYATDASDTIAATQFSLLDLRADHLGLTSGLAVVSVVTDIPPVKMAQPMIAVLGSASCLTAVAVVRRLGHEINLPRRRVRWAALLVGVGLAVEGLYLRRTGVPDEEVLGILFIPLLAIAVHRAVRTGRLSWIITGGLITLVYPLTHTFSTLFAALTVLGVVTTQILRAPTRRLAAVGTVFVGGFWAYFFGYYDLAARLGINVPYVGRILAFPGLFVAWLVMLVIGLLWLRSTSTRLQKWSLLSIILVGYSVLIANAFLPIFPGTETTPPFILLLVTAFLVPVVLASLGLPIAAPDARTGAVVISLLAAPVIMTFFSLTASLTPEYYATVLRAQTFVHFPIFILAAIAVATLSPSKSFIWRLVPARRPSPRTVVATLLIVSAAVTAPLAFVDLDTVSYPSTTTESEFAAATFSADHLSDQWTTDHPSMRIGRLYYPNETQVSLVPVGNWLNGGTAPSCPVLAAESWTTTGAHLFPQAAATLPPQRYEEWTTQRNVVYTASGWDPKVLTVPSRSDSNGC